MLSHLIEILAEFDVIPNNIMEVFSRYLFFLMLDTKKHELRAASDHFGYHESSYSRLLSAPKTMIYAKSCLNRATKRRIRALKTKKEIFLVIDATLIRRTGKKYQNKGKFHSGKTFVDGYKVTNFCLYIDRELVPLACLPHYTRSYCDECDILYQTEPEKITYWIENLSRSCLLPEPITNNLHFLLDSGYDSKAIQCAIRSIGANFTMSIKKDRQINGQQVSEYFRTHKNIRYRTIRFTVGNSSKSKSTAVYRIRSAGKSHLKGFGRVCVVSSEKIQKRGSNSAKKFLVSSKLTQSPRKTVEVYALRWKIETWHRLMKQKFGYGDCRMAKFSGIEAHLNLCLLSYQLSRAGIVGLPKPNTTLVSYLSAEQWKSAQAALTKFGGRQEIKMIAAAEVQALVL